MTEPATAELITSNFNTIVTSIVSIAASVAFSLMWLRRKLSRDSVEIHRDRAEEGVIKMLEDERDKATQEKEKAVARLEKVDNERIDALQKVGRLTTEVEYLTQQVQILKTLVENLNTSLEAARGEIHKYAIQNAEFSAKVTHLTEMVQHLEREKRDYTAI